MASGTEVGVGYISISPNAKGFGRKLDAETSGAFASVGESGGRSMGSRLAGALGTAAKVGIAAAAAGAVAATGLIVKRGFDRALDIEDAKATLGALGYAAKEVQGITDDVLASVRGTPFALNEAMSAGVSALAAGIPEGEDLTKYLQAIGDAATVAKVPFGDMGAIFNKVTGVGKVTGEVLNQMGERGIPILQWLADEYGVTAEQLREMVKEGEVDSAAFQRAIENNVGGAALAAGETTRGAWANMMAAIGRLGAGMVEGFLPQIRGGLEGLIGVIDSLAPHAQAIGQWLGQAFSWLIDEAIPAMRPAFESIVGFIGDIVSALQGANAGGGFLSTLREQVGPVVDAFMQLIEVVKPFAVEFYQNTIKPAVEGVISAFKDLATEVLPTVKVIIDYIRENWPAIRDTIEPVLRGVVQIVSGILKALANVIRLVMAVIRGDWSGAWNAIKGIASGVWQALKGMFTSSQWRKLFDGAVSALKWVGDKFLEFKDRVLGYIRDLVAKMAAPIQTAVDTIRRLNPFKRESPSLVDNVLAGTKVIRGAYENLSDMRVGGPSIGSVSAGYAASASPAAGGHSFAGATFQVNVPDGRVNSFVSELERVVSNSRLQAQMMGAL